MKDDLATPEAAISPELDDAPSERIQARALLPGLMAEKLAEAQSAEARDGQGVFPPEVFSSARVKGARRKDSRALDLRIEGLLFVTDIPMTSQEIAAVLDAPIAEVRATLREMARTFSRRRSALELRERVRRCQPAFIIDLKPEYRPDVKPLASPALAAPVIETLALIALNQPLMQSRLVRERGTRVYDHVRELVERGLISKMRAGVSYALRTTPRFSSEFGLSNDPKDLKAMLARAMSDEEQRAWEDYRAYERAKSAEEDSEEFEQAVADASLDFDPPADDEEAVLLLEPTITTRIERPALEEREEAPEAEAFEPEPDEAAPEAPSLPDSDSPFKRSASGRLSPPITDEEMDDAEDTGKLTRIQRMFLSLKARKHNA